MADRLFVLNGPNLNMLGQREPETYGHGTLAFIEARCREVAQELDFDIFCGQSNSEAQLIEWVHRSLHESAAVILNPAGFSTRSVALHDALRMLRMPVIEVHLTNIFGRESVYHTELLTARSADGFVAGFGVEGYEIAMRGLRQSFEDGF
jgi:3-dehydroquinate dehydratase II